MAVLALLLLGFVINVWAQSTGEMGEDMYVVVERNVTGVLGEDVVLPCRHVGQKQFIMSSWAIKEGRKSTRLAGYSSEPFVKHKDFSLPASPSDLTVRMHITSLEAEREYWCTFSSLDDFLESSVFLTVLVRPDVHTNVVESVENGLHYQTASCSAIAGKPAAAISWLTDGNAAADGALSISERTVQHHNGTSTQTSILRVPTHLLERADITCVISHPAMPEAIWETVTVRTFVAPNVTLLTQRGAEGEELLEVSCVAAGGWPAPNITWLLPGDAPEGAPAFKEQRDEERNAVTVTSSVSLRAYLHEGKNVTCAVTHPKLPGQLQRTITLPTYELTSVKVFREETSEMHHGNEFEGQLLLMEGERNVSVLLEVAGNVPHYRVSCARENGSLLEGVEVTGSVLYFEGPIKPLHAGLYTCQVSYYSHILSVPLEIVITPKVVLPAVVPPSIKIQTKEDVEYHIVECSASNAFPAANVSWNLPKALSGTIQSNSTFRNGTHSVTSILRLPVCLPQEHTVECVVEHPVLVTSEIRLMTLPACVSPNVTISSISVWDEGTEYTEVECSVDGGEHRATISWRVEGGDCKDCSSELVKSMMGNQTLQDGSEPGWSLLRLPTHLIAGRVIACLVDHPAFRDPERREIWIPSAGRGSSLSPPTQAPRSWAPTVFLGQLKATGLWLAVCEIREVVAGVNISWVLPENITAPAAFRSGHEEERLWARSTYVFPLAQHEGTNLTCLIQDEHSAKKTTLYIPQFYISSLRVLNKTTSYHWPLQEGPVNYRVTLRAHTPGQRILLKASGNTPQCNITCTRSDGSAVRMDGGEMVFPADVSADRDAGLYACHASFYHHSAAVLIQVEVSSNDVQLWMLTLICFSSAAAVFLILVVSLCVFCKRADSDGSRSKKKRESLAPLTPLMQGLCSPELKKTPTSCQKPPEYAELVRYSIVIDVKTTV